jgi:hypothetical protein
LNALCCPSKASNIMIGKITRPNRGADLRSPHDVVNNT